jgi:colicin import membrane protein
MSRDARFWRNVTIIALAHVAVLLGVIRWNRQAQQGNATDVVWMNGNAGDDAAAAQSSSRKTKSEQELPPTPIPEIKRQKPKEKDDEQPVLTSAKSDIQLPTPKPLPTSTTTPKPVATPKPTPKPSPKPTPKKTVVAKASPKPIATPKKSENDEETAETERKKEIAKAALAKADGSESNDESGKSAAKSSGTHGGKATGSPGAGGHGAAGGGASQNGWYGNMLHDRFYSEWVQPTTSVASGAKISALVKIRIEKDGRVSKFEIVRPSGNVVVDESIAAVAKRVTQVDSLPNGLGNGEHYDVNINFELNSDQ